MDGRTLAGLLLGESRLMKDLRDSIAKLAPSRLPVLIEGPTGAGKELVAEALHLASGRRGAFVPVNVCAIGEGLFESTLFGHVRGAFTGAAADQRGYLREADGGTIFLDEIAGLALAQQAKLLRAIESRAFRPVGASADTQSDFRVVAASNEPLDRLAAEGRFRADLLYRLRGTRVRVPALLERIEDVDILAQHFARHAAEAGSSAVLAAGAIEPLRRYEWPGNVRELRAVVEHAAVLAGGAAVQRAHVEAAMRAIHSPDASATFQGGTLSLKRPSPIVEREHRGSEEPATEQLVGERQRLAEVLAKFDWRIDRAAAHFGVHRTTLYRHMRRLGLTAKSGWLNVGHL